MRDVWAASQKVDISEYPVKTNIFSGKYVKNVQEYQGEQLLHSRLESKSQKRTF